MEELRKLQFEHQQLRQLQTKHRKHMQPTQKLSKEGETFWTAGLLAELDKSLSKPFAAGGS